MPKSRNRKGHHSKVVNYRKRVEDRKKAYEKELRSQYEKMQQEALEKQISSTESQVQEAAVDGDVNTSDFQIDDKPIDIGINTPIEGFVDPSQL